MKFALITSVEVERSFNRCTDLCYELKEAQNTKKKVVLI